MESVYTEMSTLFMSVFSYKTTVHFKQMMLGKYSRYFFKVQIRGKTGKYGVCLSREKKHNNDKN